MKNLYKFAKENRILEYTTLGVMIHKKCNASCEICCTESNVQCKEKLDIDLTKKFIYSTKNNRKLSTISFTGGEPFLELDILKNLISFTSNINKNPTCITNGFWASDYDFTYDTLKELKCLGLRQLSISYDNYHKEFVDAQNIINVLRVARTLNMPVFLGIIKTSGEKTGHLIDELGDDILNAYIQVAPCYPTGRAKKIFNEKDFIRNMGVEKLLCPYNGYMSVSYDGKIYPCCSQFALGTELYIGTYIDYDYIKVLDRIKKNGILYILRNFGFDSFANIAKNKLNIKIPDLVTSPCELCSIFFNKDTIHKFIPYVNEMITKHTQELQYSIT